MSATSNDHTTRIDRLDSDISVKLIIMIKQFDKIERCERHVTEKDVHVKFASVNNVAFLNFHKASRIRTASSVDMKKVTCQRIQDHVNAFSVGSCKHCIHE